MTLSFAVKSRCGELVTFYCILKELKSKLSTKIVTCELQLKERGMWLWARRLDGDGDADWLVIASRGRGLAGGGGDGVAVIGEEVRVEAARGKAVAGPGKRQTSKTIVGILFFSTKLMREKWAHIY